MANKNETLANFQACTGIEDYGEAFTYLDSCNWDLVVAINKALPDQQRQEDPDISVVNNISPILNSLTSPLSASASVEQVDVIDLDSSAEAAPVSLINHSYASSPFENNEPVSIASSSRTNTDVLDVNIQILSDGLTHGNSFPLELPASTTVSELKTLLHQLVGIPACNQLLEGFEKPVSGETVISRDLLPKSMSISLNITSSVPVYNQFQRHNGRVKENFNLLIHDEKNSRDYSLHYGPNKLFSEIKTDIFQLTVIPARLQVWSGWPSEISEDSSLASIGISNVHHLTVNQQSLPTPTQRTPKAQRKTTKNHEGGSEDTSSTDEFEDASELLPEDDFMLMCDVPSSQGRHPLIPPNIDDEAVGVLSFVDNFNNRFGSCVPLFYHGTLEMVLKESVMLPAKKRKPLAVYLHHDKSVLANVFCSQSLCHLSIVDYLTNNFVIWGWDLTHESNKAKLLNMISSNFGHIASSTVRSYSLEKLPALLIINKSRGSVEILSVIHGNVILDEMMTSLMHANEIFEEQRKAEAIEESEREQRETMMAEQDAAYHASLEADRAKAQAKKTAELVQRQERERQQSLREQEDAMKEAVRSSLEMDLPPEPGPDCSEPISKLRFRIPKGEPLVRAFTRSTPLQVVLNYLCVKGYSQDEYKYIQSWPRRCITTLNSAKTISEIGMHNQETINVEERCHEMDHMSE